MRNPRFLLAVWVDMGGANQALFQNKLRAFTDTGKIVGSREEVAGLVRQSGEANGPINTSQLTTETLLGRQVGICTWLVQLKYLFTETSCETRLSCT